MVAGRGEVLTTDSDGSGTGRDVELGGAGVEALAESETGDVAPADGEGPSPTRVTDTQALRHRLTARPTATRRAHGVRPRR